MTYEYFSKYDIAEKKQIFTLIDLDRDETILTQEEWAVIDNGAQTEHVGYAVYDVEAIICVENEKTDWERKMVAYLADDVWTYVPEAFETMTIHWKGE